MTNTAWETQPGIRSESDDPPPVHLYNEKGNSMAHSHHHHPKGAGKSSFELIDTDRFFNTLDLQPGMTFLDVACGRGVYSLAASERVGKAGMVHALDLWADGIDHLKKTVADRGIKNIHASVADAAQTLDAGCGLAR